MALRTDQSLWLDWRWRRTRRRLWLAFAAQEEHDAGCDTSQQHGAHNPG